MLGIKNIHNYQKKAANHILSNKASWLVLECGLGKSVVVLSALSRIKGRVLILAPLRVAHSVWPDEITKWEHTKNMSYEVLHGAADIKKLTSKAKIQITNYEFLVHIESFLKEKTELPWQTLVIDESSKVKAHDTKRFKILKKLRAGFRRIILLTGTPCPQGLMDLWAQAFILDGGERLGTAITHFRNKYFYQPNQYQRYRWDERDGTKKKLTDKLKDITISMKAKDYLELPPVIKNRIKVELDDISLDIYNELENEFFYEFDNNKVTVANAAILSSKLRQVLQGAVYGEDGKTTILNTMKVEVLKDMVDGTDTPILCAYQFKFEVDLIKKNIPKAVFINSDLKKTGKIIDKWNDGKIKLLCVHPASAGHGLNLQHGGHTIVWLALTWSLEHYLQLNARLDRQGQKHKVIIHHIVANNTVDERVAKALTDKNVTQEGIINSLK